MPHPIVNVQTNDCNNNLLILGVKQLSKTMKRYYFFYFKSTVGGQGKIKMFYGMSSVQKQLSGKRSIHHRNFVLLKLSKTKQQGIYQPRRHRT